MVLIDPLAKLTENCFKPSLFLIVTFLGVKQNHCKAQYAWSANLYTDHKI